MATIGMERTTTSTSESSLQVFSVCAVILQSAQIEVSSLPSFITTQPVTATGSQVYMHTYYYNNLWYYFILNGGIYKEAKGEGSGERNLDRSLAALISASQFSGCGDMFR